jgi:glycosyltransferase involved in cell wall biosynthesis
LLNIAVVAPGYPNEQSGGFGFVHARVKYYQKTGHRVRVYLPGKGENYRFEEVEVVYTDNPGLISGVREQGAQVMAIHYPNYAVKKLVHGCPLPRVVWVHGHEILWTFEISLKAKSPIHWLFKRLLLIPRLIQQSVTTGKFIRRCERSVFVSEWMKREAERHGLGKFRNGVVVPNPVDTALFSYHQPADASICVSVRSFSNNKYGIDIAIRAFSNVSDVRLDIYGKGRLQQKFEDLIRKTASTVRLIPGSLRHSEIPEIYRKYGVFVAPSRVEAQGVSMCEAMASGLPVVATNIGGIPEFVRNGVDGYLVPANNPKALLEAIRKIGSDTELHRLMSRNAREQAERVFSAEVICAKEISVMQEAISRK